MTAEPDDDPVEGRLESERVVPDAGFRAGLGKVLRSAHADVRPRPRPERVGMLVIAYAVAGIALLLLAVAGIAGIGPLP